MKRLVIDPGVLLSAFISPRRSPPSIILEAILDERIAIIACPALIAELTEVLHRAKFARYTRRRSAGQYIDSIAEHAEHAPDPPACEHRTGDPDDDYLLALAHAQHADAVISGDKHLRNANTPAMPILTPRQLADLLHLDDQHPAAGQAPDQQ